MKNTILIQDKTEEHKVPDATKKKATLPDWSNMNKIQRAEYLANKVKRAEEELDNRTLSEHWKNEPEKYPHRQQYLVNIEDIA